MSTRSGWWVTSKSANSFPCTFLVTTPHWGCESWSSRTHSVYFFQGLCLLVRMLAGPTGVVLISFSAHESVDEPPILIVQIFMCIIQAITIVLSSCLFFLLCFSVLISLKIGQYFGQ